MKNISILEMKFVDYLENKKKERKVEKLIEKSSSIRKKMNKVFIKEELTNQIKKEGKPDLKENKLHLSHHTGKIQIKRPKITVERIIKESPKLVGLKKLNNFNNSGRAKTGIPGVDKVTNGGIRRNTVNLVGGGAGSGKSIFCMQFLAKGIDNSNEKGIYISFEESKNKILSNFKKFGWNLEKKLKDKKLEIIYFTPEQVNKVVESGGGLVRDIIEDIGAKRLVIDSLTAYTLLYTNPLDKRRAVLDLFETLHKWRVTVLVTSEQEPDPVKHKSTIMEFEVDGVILLYNLKRGDVRERSFEVFKMRGTKHAVRLFPMVLNDKGISIYPESSVF